MATVIERLGSFLALKPKRAAAIVLALCTAFLLVAAGLFVQLAGIGRAPYPQDDSVPLSLVDGHVVYSQSWTRFVYENGSVMPYRYSDMKVALMLHFEGHSGTVTGPFGNQALLSTNSSASMDEPLWVGGSDNMSVILTIKDSTGDGSFNYGDTVVFNIIPLRKDSVHVFGLYWRDASDRSTSTEISFAIHGGHLYKWWSNDLPTQTPWWL